MNRNYVTEENRIYLPDEKWNILAEIDFEKIDEKTYNISHTFVDDSLRGQGIGSELVEKTIAYLTEVVLKRPNLRFLIKLIMLF